MHMTDIVGQLLSVNVQHSISDSCQPTLTPSFAKGFQNTTNSTHQYSTFRLVYCPLYVIKKVGVEFGAIEYAKESKACAAQVLPN